MHVLSSWKNKTDIVLQVTVVLGKNLTSEGDWFVLQSSEKKGVKTVSAL